MIMALIYRNVGRKKTTEMLLLGERLTAEEAREAGIVNKVVAAEEFDAAVADWAAKLASKSPLVMQLGKDAMWRQLDMPLVDALDYLRAAADDRALDRGRDRGRHRLLREARPGMEGTMSEATESEKVAAAAEEAGAPEAPPATGGKLKGLTDDLHARREKAKLGGGEEKIAKQHAAGKLTARERIDLLVDAGTFVEIGIHAGPHFSQRSMEGKEAPADGVITGWGDVDGRPVRDRRLRLHRDGRARWG